MGIESDVHWGYDLDFDPWYVQLTLGPCQLVSWVRFSGPKVGPFEEVC